VVVVAALMVVGAVAFPADEVSTDVCFMLLLGWSTDGWLAAFSGCGGTEGCGSTFIAVGASAGFTGVTAVAKGAAIGVVMSCFATATTALFVEAEIPSSLFCPLDGLSGFWMTLRPSIGCGGLGCRGESPPPSDLAAAASEGVDDDDCLSFADACGRDKDVPALACSFATSKRGEVSISLALT